MLSFRFNPSLCGAMALSACRDSSNIVNPEPEAERNDGVTKENRCLDFTKSD